MRTRSHLLAPWMLLGVALIWGWTFVLVKESLQEVGTFAFLFYRFTLAFLLLLGLFGPRLRGVERRVWAKGALIGLTLFLGYWFQTLGLNFTTATNSAFITGLSVVLVPVLGALAFRERVTGAAWLGATLSAFGLGLIVFGASSSFEALTLNVGDVLTFLCAISFALQILLISRFARPENHLPILVAQIGVVALLSALGMWLFEDLAWPTSPVAWKGIVITGVFATALAFWVQTRFQPLSTATRTAIIFSSEPVFAALFGYWLLGERLIGAQWLGAVFIVSAMVIAQWPARRRVDELLSRSKQAL